MEARFQSGLSAFLTADSYATIDDRLGDPRKRKEFVAALQRAKSLFEKLADDHRREVAGLYGSLWAARCLTALGDQRRGMRFLNRFWPMTTAIWIDSSERSFIFGFFRSPPRETTRRLLAWRMDG